jgi:hypothetical protein
VTTRTRWWGRRRLALGLSPTPGSGLALLVVGMVLGPAGLGLLSSGTLDALDPLVSLALAALGVFVGLDLRFGGAHEWRLLRAGTLEAGVTIGVVALGCALAAMAAPGLFAPTWLVPVMLGICAASSSTVADHDEAHAHATRLNDLDDVLPIVLAGAIAVSLRAGAPGAAAWLLLQTAVMAVLLAVATVLLVRQAAAESEQRVFTIGAVLLLGGIAAHLSLSALAGGLLAGLCWNLAGGAGREHIVRDLRYLQHPLTVPVLVIAGARMSPTSSMLALLLVYVALRSAGKVIGHGLSRRVAFGPATAATSAWQLTSPGVVGIAIALEFARTAGQPPAVTVLSVIVAGALAFELLSWLLAREGVRP